MSLIVPVSYKGKPIPGLGLPIPHLGPQIPWIAETWNPGVQVLWPGSVNETFSGQVVFTLGTVGGVIYYSRFRLPTSPVVAAVFVYAMQTQLADLWNQAKSNILDPIEQLIFDYQAEAAFAGLVGIGLAVGGRALVSKVETARLQLMTSLSGSLAPSVGLAIA